MPLTKTRISYEALNRHIDKWNSDHGLKYLDKGFIQVSNDGSTHWLTELAIQGSTGTNSIHGSSGTIRSCYELLMRL